MKIHDKFVIELREVIKGYGNNPTVQDLCKFPCDYKFYEIEGVAICENSFKKMKPLGDEVNAVLDKVRAEIDAHRKTIRNMAYIDDWYAGKLCGHDCDIEIIDKYREEVTNGNN